MKLRVTVVALTAVVIGCILLFGMTKAELIEAVQATYGVDFNGDGTPDTVHDCWLLGSPQDSSEVIEVRDDTKDEPGTKIPGLHRFGNIILHFPTGKIPPEIVGWHQNILKGRFTAHNAVLVILGTEEGEKSVFNLFECWPSAVRRFRQTRIGFRGAVVDEVEFVVGRNEMVLTEKR